MKKGFTLTEVLLALAIIGVVAAITIPAFYNSYGNKVASAQLKKVCTLITNAARHIITDENTKDLSSLNSDYDANTLIIEAQNEEDEDLEYILGFYTTSAGVKTSNAEKGAQFFLTKYFKHTSLGCGAGDCLADEYLNSNGTSVGAVPASFYCIKSQNNAAICMRFKEGINRTQVLVDVNGSDRPNITGSDVFVMFITDDGDLKDLDENPENCNQRSANDDEDILRYAAGCFHKILGSSWNMNN